jgi:hypothetical protein
LLTNYGPHVLFKLKNSLLLILSTVLLAIKWIFFVLFLLLDMLNFSSLSLLSFIITIRAIKLLTRVIIPANNCSVTSAEQ